LDAWPDGIHDLYCRNLDGFLIKGVLSPAEVSEILARWEAFPKEQKFPITDGIEMYPLSFAQMDQGKEGSRERMRTYFGDCIAYESSFPDVFGIDIQGRLKSILGKLSGGRILKVPVGVDGVGHYVMGNFRVLTPGSGNLNIHCGNFFHHEFPNFFTHLEEQASVLDQMSYFFMLQPAEAGGELCVMDVEWAETKVRLPGAKTLQKEDGTVLDIEDWVQVPRQMFRPEAGDMILFAGGQIWHRVEYVKGSRSRITFGGFLSMGHDEGEIFYWT
jgi:hypothetical protein